MVKKYPEYVSTDLDLWNSADEAHFFVVKNKAKPISVFITPIIDNALESGLLREATETEIEEYLLEKEIEKYLLERRFDRGHSWKETLINYNKWKETFNQNKSDSNGKDLNNKIVQSKKEKIETTGIVKEIKDDIIEDDKKDKSTISPTKNALNQKPSVSTSKF